MCERCVDAFTFCINICFVLIYMHVLVYVFNLQRSNDRIQGAMVVKDLEESDQEESDQEESDLEESDLEESDREEWDLEEWDLEEWDKVVSGPAPSVQAVVDWEFVLEALGQVRQIWLVDILIIYLFHQAIFPLCHCWFNCLIAFLSQVESRQKPVRLSGALIQDCIL